MQMVKVIDGQIVAYSLPETGILKDGRTVSNYNLLPPETLAAEGWLPLIDEKPTYDPATQYLILESEAIEEEQVTATYIVVDIITFPNTPSEIDLLKADLAEQKLQTQLLDLKLNIISESVVI